MSECTPSKHSTATTGCTGVLLTQPRVEEGPSASGRAHAARDRSEERGKEKGAPKLRSISSVQERSFPVTLTGDTKTSGVCVARGPFSDFGRKSVQALYAKIDHPQFTLAGTGMYTWRRRCEGAHNNTGYLMVLLTYHITLPSPKQYYSNGTPPCAITIPHHIPETPSRQSWISDEDEVWSLGNACGSLSCGSGIRRDGHSKKRQTKESCNTLNLYPQPLPYPY